MTLLKFMKIVFITLLLMVAVAEVQEPPIVFEDITEKSGLLDSLSGMMGHSAAWGDIDKDGLPDLFVGGFCDRTDSEYAPAKGPVPARIFRNLGSGKFTLIKNSEVEFFGRTTSAVFADMNKDGFPDLYVANNSLKHSTVSKSERQIQSQLYPSLLFHNQGGTLKNISSKSGSFAHRLPGARGIGVLDYNGDRLLDLLIIQDTFQADKEVSAKILFRNTGNLHFQDVTYEAGIPGDLFGLGVAIADLNDDAKPDFFVSHSNRLFLSTPENKYREAEGLESVFYWDPLDAEDWACGVAFGDLNRDGLLDLVISAHHDPARNRVYINQGLKKGVPQFKNVTEKVGLADRVPTKCPHVEIQDFDNDGWMDIYMSAAWKEGGKVIPLLYRNEGPHNGLIRFSTSHPVTSPMIYFPSGPSVDVDLDGRMDIFLVNWFAGETSHLFLNRSKVGNWLQVKGPIGTKIKLYSAGELIGYQQIYVGYGSHSGQMPIAHFGVGKLQTVSLEVLLPDGTVKKSEKVDVNKRLEF